MKTGVINGTAYGTSYISAQGVAPSIGVNPIIGVAPAGTAKIGGLKGSLRGGFA